MVSLLKARIDTNGKLVFLAMPGFIFNGGKDERNDDRRNDIRPSVFS